MLHRSIVQYCVLRNMFSLYGPLCSALSGRVKQVCSVIGVLVSSLSKDETFSVLFIIYTGFGGVNFKGTDCVFRILEYKYRYLMSCV